MNLTERERDCLDDAFTLALIQLHERIFKCRKLYDRETKPILKGRHKVTLSGLELQCEETYNLWDKLAKELCS